MELAIATTSGGLLGSIVTLLFVGHRHRRLERLIERVRAAG